MKILIVEDEESLNKVLVKVLRRLGYTTDSAFDGEEALDLYFENTYDLVILDLNLPKLDGMEVLNTIREDNVELPILILSARSEIQDKIQGLDEGANDYLTKPFHFDELTARVRALLRRNFQMLGVKIQIGDVELDTTSKTFMVAGNPVALSKKEYGVMAYLMLRKGETISAQKLIESVWESDTEEMEKSFYVHISALRRKLPEGFIKNVRGQGYYVG
ncbi:MAG: response regulator transcription factor [Defluviitaleaceae bacterium]|nr:response regulator transcription factor [Defluviitaleaceae bacterium]